MFMGDAEQAVQSSLAKSFSGDRLLSKIIKVAHHGSEKAVDDDF